MSEILDRLDEMNESGVIAYDVYSELHDLASQLQERKVGKWIDCGFVDKSFKEYKCSNCSDFVYEKPYQIKYHKYCLHCGAEMRGRENE